MRRNANGLLPLKGPRTGKAQGALHGPRHPLGDSETKALARLPLMATDLAVEKKGGPTAGRRARKLQHADLCLLGVEHPLARRDSGRPLAAVMPARETPQRLRLRSVSLLREDAGQRAALPLMGLTPRSLAWKGADGTTDGRPLRAPSARA